jgi:hypothetical protein
MSVAEFLSTYTQQNPNRTFSEPWKQRLAGFLKPVQPLALMLGKVYADSCKKMDFHSALEDLEISTTRMQRHDLNLSWLDDDLCAWCEAKSTRCVEFLQAGQATDDEGKLIAICNEAAAVAERYGIEAPDTDDYGYLPTLGRLADAKWWRLKARRLQALEVEKIAILLGRVRKGAEVYCSDEGIRRRSYQRHRNRKYLENTHAENQAGDVYTLAQLADLTVSNPRLKRNELMLRIRGFDEVAVMLGHVREFWTMTAPSRFHRWTTVGKGRVVRENKKWDGSMPSDAQGWLCDCWARIRAALARYGVRLYGFRVVEAHHDGTPHWHMAMFYRPHWQGDERRAAAPRVRAIVRRYGLAEETIIARKARQLVLRTERTAAHIIDRANRARAQAEKVTLSAVKTWVNAWEKADMLAEQSTAAVLAAKIARKENHKARRLLADATAHRCDFKKIDPEKGDAAGYLAKYITKAIDATDAGELVGQDLYGYDAGVSARRVEAWASRHRVRQFQQIGGPSVSAWRELRRAHSDEAIQLDLLGAPQTVQLAAHATTFGNWWAFVFLMGGPMVRRDDQLIRIDYAINHDPETGELRGPVFDRYGGEPGDRVTGISYDYRAEHIATRNNVWTISRPGDATPKAEPSPHIQRETHDAMRATDAMTEWKPWAFDVLDEIDAADDYGAGFCFSGGATAPPLDSYQ